MLSFLHCAPIDSQSAGHLSIDLELIVKYQCPTILEPWHCCLTMGIGVSCRDLVWEEVGSSVCTVVDHMFQY